MYYHFFICFLLQSLICLCVQHGSFVERDEEETVDVEGEGEIETYEDYDWTLRPPFTLNSFHGMLLL